MPAEKISLQNAKEDKLFYFVANVVPYRESDGRCLILKRSMREKVHPGKYCVPGGKLEWKDLDIANPTRRNGDVLDYQDTIEKLLAKEVMEEAGIQIGKELVYINSVAFIRPDGIPVVLIKFGGKYVDGEVRLEEGGFDGYEWVNAEEVKNFDCISGILEEVSKTIQIFQNSVL